MTGRFRLSLPEIRGHIRQLMETRSDLTPEQRYSLMAALEAFSFLERLSPGLRKALDKYRGTFGIGAPVGARNGGHPAKPNGHGDDLHAT